MKRLALVLMAVSAVFLFVSASAAAKGASEATITGPGLYSPITLAGEGQPGGARLEQLAELGGFFPAVFVRSPDPMRDERPAGDLGPKYSIVYVMPGPNPVPDRIAQDVYPYAEPNPVSYTAPGQPFFGTERTRGGWFVAPSYFKDQLVEVGLSATPPASGDTDGFPWSLASRLGAVAAALALGALATNALRRRLGAAHAA